MKKTTRSWLIAAICLIVIGGTSFACALAYRHWNFADFTTEQQQITTTREVTEAFDRILIRNGTANLSLLPATDGVCRVVCRESEKVPHLVEVRDGELCIRTDDRRNWTDHIGVNVLPYEITLYLPEREYASLTVEGSTADAEIPQDFRFGEAAVELSTGDICFRASVAGRALLQTGTGEIRVEGGSFGELSLTVTTGQTTVADVACESLSSDGSTGDIALTRVLATGNITAVRSTGDITLQGSDAAELRLRTSTGDVTGSLLTAKCFLAESATGSIDVPTGGIGGKCEVSTSTGDILLTVGK